MRESIREAEASKGKRVGAAVGDPARLRHGRFSNPTDKPSM